MQSPFVCTCYGTCAKTLLRFYMPREGEGETEKERKRERERDAIKFLMHSDEI